MDPDNKNVPAEPTESVEIPSREEADDGADEDRFDPSDMEDDENPLYEDDDDPYGFDVAADLNTDDTEDLDAFDPGMLYGGAAESPMMPHDEPLPTPGRPSSPRIWKSAQTHKAVTGLQVYKSRYGKITQLGVISSDANMDEFVEFFYDDMPQPGEEPVQFYVRPVDREGNEIAGEVSLPLIGPNHRTLKAIRESRRVGTEPAAAHAPAVDPMLYVNPFMTMVQSQQEQDRIRSARADEELRWMRQREMERLDKTADERGAFYSGMLEQQAKLSETGLQQTASFMERQLRTEESRGQWAVESVKSQSETLTQFLTLQMERENQAAQRRLAEEEERRRRIEEEERIRRERERAEAEERRREERAEAERRIQVMQSEADRRWEREKLELQHREERLREERAAERERLLMEREHERERARAEREETARRMQMEHEMKLAAMKSEAERNREHQAMMLQLQMRNMGTPASLIEQGAELLRKFGMEPSDLMGMVKEAVFKGDDKGLDPSVFAAFGGAAQEGIKQIGEFMRARQAPQIAQQPVFQPPMMTATQPAPPQIPTYDQPVPPGYTGPVRQYAEPQQPQQPPQPPQQPQQPQPVVDIPLADQKRARAALRQLVTGLRSTPQEEWERLTVETVTAEMAVFAFARATSIRYALAEGGADPDLIQAFLNHPACNLIPPEVPR